MKVVGVIAEYNPLHYGHAYQLTQIRKWSKADILLVVMSGNVVQRGEFACLDKWTRAELAIQAGADLVFELPLFGSLQSADFFSEMAVTTLAKLGCEAFYFGTETASLEELTDYHDKKQAHDREIQEALQANLSQGYAYPAAYQKAVESILGEVGFDPSRPNHLLGLGYIKANQDLAKPMQVDTIQRIHNQDEALLSASQVREMAKKGALEAKHVPAFTFDAISQKGFVDQEDYWPFLHYQLLTHTPQTLSKILFVKEGIEHRILTLNVKAKSWAHLQEGLISKRWTRAAVQRLLLAILCQIDREGWLKYGSELEEHLVTRLLAYRQNARPFLRNLGSKDRLTVISNWKKDYQKSYHYSLTCDRIFSLNPRIPQKEQNIRPFPQGK